MLDWIGAFILACEQWRLVRMEFKCVFMGDFLLRTVKTADGADIVSGIDPLVASPERATAKLGIFLDGAYGLPQDIQVDAVEFDWSLLSSSS